MGISDEDLDSITGDMMNALSGVEDMMDVDNDGSDDSEDDGKTATFPFLNRLFGGPPTPPAQGDGAQNNDRQPRQDGDKAPKQPKRKFLDNYCIDLTARAREGKLDSMIAVSYTHLDVYKRQVLYQQPFFAALRDRRAAQSI